MELESSSCDNMVDDSTLRLSIFVASFFVIGLFARWYRRDPLVGLTSLRPPHFIADRRGSQLDAIPTVGFSDPILSYLSALRFIFDGLSMLKYGYAKVNDLSLSYFPCSKLMIYSQTGRGLFKIATLRRWMVLASSPEMIEDLRKAPDDVLSVTEHTREVLMLSRTLDSYPHRFFQFIQSEYTLDLLDIDSHYQNDVIRLKLTRNIADTFKEVHDELVRSLDVSIPVHGDGA